MAQPHRSKLPPWLDGPVAVALRTLMSVPLVVGLEPALRAAKAIGGLYPVLQKRRFKRTVAHIREAFPEWSPEQVEVTAKQCWEHLAQFAVELLYAPRLITEEGHTRHLAFTEINGALRELTSNRPVIMLTGHCGHWELMGYSVAMLGFPMYAIYRPLDLKPLDEWVHETRERRGLELVSKFGAVNKLPPLVEAGHTLGIVADQSGGDRGIFVPFFGRLTSTYKWISLLARQTNATIVCGSARRLGDQDHPPAGTWQRSACGGRMLIGDERSSMRYSIEINDIFGPEDWAEVPDASYYIAARYRRAMEIMVRRAPEQYLWAHRIWRARPLHERTGKPFPDQLKAKLEALPWMTQTDVQGIIDRSNRDAACIARGETPPAA